MVKKFFIVSLSFIILVLFQLIVEAKAVKMDPNLILVNKKHPMNESSYPKELYQINAPSINNKYLLYEAKIHYEMLYEKSRSEGYEFIVYSAYRDYEYQKKLYTGFDDYQAKPGESEHHTGLALDITIHGIGLYPSLGSHSAGIWLKNNIEDFGFIERYPKGKEDITGYPYEPWHIRYVGIYHAKKMKSENLTLEEYLLKYYHIS